MGIYKELGLKTIINASDTYTKIGGSVMSGTVLKAMGEAGESFVNIQQLSATVGNKIAELTDNESAFVSCGCAACIVLCCSAVMSNFNIETAKRLPDTSGCDKDEFIVFTPQTEIEALPYWRLIELSGAKVVTADPSLDGLKDAVSGKTAGVWLFAGTMYEEQTPDFGEVIEFAHSLKIPVFVDAAAQIPPFSNLWYYTKTLAADGAVFSGGKYIKGPQSSGFFVGRKDIADFCHKIASPNVAIGRPYKVGKEEYVGLYTAIKELSELNENTKRQQQNELLDIVEKGLISQPVTMTRCDYGRLGQEAPRLMIKLTGATGADCAEFLYNSCDPAIDIGYFLDSDHTGEADEIFVNSINLKHGDAEYIVDCLKRYFTRGI